MPTPIADPIPATRNGPPLTIAEESEIVAGSLYHALWHYIVTYKESAFASKSEVRFIYTAHDYSQASGSRCWYPEHPETLSREHAGRVIP